MCGITGILDLGGNARRHRDALVCATDRIAHRGPDAEGYFFEGAIGLGFRRLSILDLSVRGSQPMTSRDGAWTVVFNGEIYNFIELRRALVGVGVTFQSDSDTEVLVESLAAFGTRCFDTFNGMWAVLAWHTPSQTLYACRDPWGIKPLFVAEQPGWIGFASEIKAIKSMGARHSGVEALAARRFIDEGLLDTDDRTLFSGFSRLTPGVLFAWRDGKLLSRTKYLDGTHLTHVPTEKEGERGLQQFQEAFRAAFLSSVRLRLRADVDVGTSLSGGLDSTAVACSAARFLDAERVTTCRHAFTAVMPEYDETPYIKAVLAQTGAQWHVTVAADRTLAEQAEGFFRAHDEPVHSLSPLAGFLVMELAHKANVKVLLNGQGADELLAGYTSIILPYLRSVLASEGTAVAWREAVAEGGSVAAGVELLSRAQGGSLARTLLGGLEGSARLRLARLRALDPSSSLLRDDGGLGHRFSYGQPPSDTLRAAQEQQVRHSPLPLYLRIEDTNSSAFSLESRLPFLDPAVVALARAAPPRILRRGGLNKFLLRSILPGIVPDIVWQRRDKMGFPVPTDRWIRGPLRPLVLDTLAPDRLRARGWYDVSRVIAARDQALSGAAGRHEPHLMRIFLLEKWARDHLDA